MKKILTLLLCSTLLIITTSATNYADHKAIAATTVNKLHLSPNFLLPLLYPTSGSIQTLVLEGKIVNGKYVFKNHKKLVFPANTYYIVFLYQDEGRPAGATEDNYDIRFSLGEGSTEYGLVPANAPQAITGSVIAETSLGNISGDITIPAGSGSVDEGTYPLSGPPTLTTYSISLSYFVISGVEYPVSILQFPQDVQ